MRAISTALTLLVTLFSFLNLSHCSCQNGGTLTDSGCVCDRFWAGENCTIPNCVNGFLNLTEKLYCVCYPGWGGLLCEIEKVCDHGTLLGNETCICLPGYGGELCDEEKVTCIHGTKIASWICFCEHGWSGESCDIPSCKHGIYNESSNSCKCNPGYFGPLCKNVNCFHGSPIFGDCLCDLNWEGQFCHIPQCRNGAKVEEIDGKFVCSCPTGFYGDLCDHRRCVNGWDVIGSCYCRDRWEGNFCEQPVCENDGHRSDDGRSCICDEIYEGTFCEKLSSYGCIHGKLYYNKCHCDKGYAGKFCTEEKNPKKNSEQKEDNSWTLWVVCSFAAVGCIILLVSAFAAFNWCRNAVRKRFRNRRENSIHRTAEAQESTPQPYEPPRARVEIPAVPSTPLAAADFVDTVAPPTYVEAISDGLPSYETAVRVHKFEIDG